MKTLQTLILTAVLFYSCEKADVTTWSPPPPINLVGTWSIIPNGTPTDSFRYVVTSPLHPDRAFVPDLVKAGRVSTPGSYIVHLVENSRYVLYYLDCDGQVQTIERRTDSAVVMFTDTIPATVYSL